MTHKDVSDEETSFASLIGPVTPFPKPQQSPNFGKPRKTRQQIRREAQLTRQLAAQLPPSIDANFDSIPEELFQNMTREKTRYQRVFDCHGKTVAEAKTSLQDALASRDNRRLALWLVIHGKGNNSPKYDRAPIKYAVLDLLRRHPAVAAIRARYDSDQQSGAVVIAVKPPF